MDEVIFGRVLERLRSRLTKRSNRTYLRFYSIILLGVVDSAGRFIYAGAGVNGKASGGGVWKKSKFNQQLTSGELDLPGQGDGENPFVFVADQAFPLKSHLIKPLFAP